MVEIQHQRVEVRRQTKKGYDEGAGPRTVSEALSRLKKVSQCREARREVQLKESNGEGIEEPHFEKLRPFKQTPDNKKKNKDPEEGRVITKLEPEIKTHTSYLTFAVLPREWSEEEEEMARAEVKKISKGTDKGVVGEKEKKWQKPEGEKLSKRAQKKAAREQRKKAMSEGGKAGDQDNQGQAEAVVKEETVDVMDVDS